MNDRIEPQEPQGPQPRDPQPRDPQEEAFASELRKAFIRPPDAATRRDHLARMAEIEPDTVVGPVRGKRRTAVRGRALRGGLVAAGLVLVGGSALAATGTLPDAVQNAIADAVDPVVDLPGGSEDSAAGGNPKNPIAAANKAEADAFTDAKKAYNACLKAEREAAAESPETSPAESQCGEKPQRQDFRTDKSPKPERTPKVSGDDRTPKPRNTNAPEKTERPDRTERPERTARPTPPSDPGPPD